MLEAALDAAGLDRAVIGLGDADLYRQLLTELGVEGEARDSILARLATHDLVGLEAELSEVEGIGEEQVATCVALSPAARRPRGARPGARLGGVAVERATARLGETSRAGASAAPPAGSRSTSGCCATSATTAAPSSRSTTPRSATSSAAAAATTA